MMMVVVLIAAVGRLATKFLLQPPRLPRSHKIPQRLLRLRGNQLIAVEI